MKVKITRPTRAGGKSLVAGKSYDLSDRDAKTLIKMGKAIPVKAKAKGKDDDSDNAGGGSSLNTDNSSALVS